MKIFVDTGPLIAMVTPRDQWRKATLTIIEKLSPQKPQLYTTDYIVNEAFTGLQKTKGTSFYRINQLNDYIFKEKSVSFEWVTYDRFLKTKSFFLRVTKDKSWSFTDCASFVVMKELKIKTVFTFDEHFEQMGFEQLD